MFDALAGAPRAKQRRPSFARFKLMVAADCTAKRSKVDTDVNTAEDKVTHTKTLLGCAGGVLEVC